MDIKVLVSGSKGNCYLVKNEDTTLLIECGMPYKKLQQALNFKVSSIDGCLITHEHMDHAKAAKDLVKAGVDVYMTQGTQQVLGIEGHRCKTFTNTQTPNHIYDSCLIGSFYIHPFYAIHDVKEPVCFYVLDIDSNQSMAFITDTQYLPHRFEVDYLMIEVNYVTRVINSRPDLNPVLRKRIKESHMSLETAIDYLKKLNLDKLKKIYVMHLSDFNSDAGYIKKKIEEVTGVSVEIC